MTYDIKSILPQMPYGDRDKRKKPTPQVVDSLADQLAAELESPKLRRWYCGVIYKFGVSKVDTWRRRALEGKTPAALFTHYVNAAGGYRKGGGD